jgi:hypothetical protein
MRKLALLLAAAILPACDTRTQRDNVRVSVHNQGTQTVRVDLQVRRSGFPDIDREDLLSPGGDVLFEYDAVTRVALQVYRTSDDLKIFDDFWTVDDLRRLDDDVAVTVTP